MKKLSLNAAREDWSGEWSAVEELLKTNPQAPFGVCYATADLGLIFQGRTIKKLVLVGPEQTIKSLDIAAKIQLDKELISTTIWPDWWIENPYYKGD